MTEFTKKPKGMDEQETKIFDKKKIELEVTLNSMLRQHNQTRCELCVCDADISSYAKNLYTNSDEEVVRTSRNTNKLNELSVGLKPEQGT